MKNIRGLLISGLSGALVVSGVLVWRIAHGAGQADRPPVSRSAQAERASGSVGSTNPIQESVGSKPGVGQADPSAEGALEALRRDPQWRWRRPIAFWGLVLDELDQPVADARVEMTWTDLSPAGYSSTTMTSDGSGRVRLEGKEGAVLTVRASREGFHSTREAHRILNYGEPWDPRFHRPNPDQPEVLRLRRMGPAEPLIHRENLRFPVTSATGELFIDLVGQRAVTSGGDLTVTVRHGPERSVEGHRRFDWEVVVAGVDGGLVVHEEEFPFLSPETGYLSEFRFQQAAEDSAWRDSFERRFFLRSRNGAVHARIELRVSPFPRGAPPTVTLLDYYLNPSGSRNLEYTPELDVSAEHYNRVRKAPR